MLIDHKISWVPQISSITEKLLQVNGLLHRARNQLTISLLKSVYYSIAHSRLLYCLEIWGNGYQSHYQQLVRAQKRLIRTISKVPLYTPSEHLFAVLGVRPVLEEIKIRRAILAFEIVKAPHRFGINIGTEHAHTYPTRFARTCLPTPTFRTQRHGSLSLVGHITKDYNILPSNVKSLSISQLNLAKRLIAAFFTT